MDELALLKARYEAACVTLDIHHKRWIASSSNPVFTDLTATKDAVDAAYQVLMADHANYEAARQAAAAAFESYQNAIDQEAARWA
jgi:hypothetical protein